MDIHHAGEPRRTSGPTPFRLWSPPEPQAKVRAPGRPKGRGKAVVKPGSQSAMPKLVTPSDILQALEKACVEFCQNRFLGVETFIMT
jgi:hypothetical protein